MGKRESASSEKEKNKKKKKTRTGDVNEVMELDSQDLSLEGRYDVFLNHRGPDVKNSFVSHLYDLLRVRGCNPFLDVESLIKGDHALNSINEALHGARVHVAIFSKGYAESKYCLNELCDMMKSSATVIPVFFKDIEPGHLRWIEDGPFAEAFQKHSKKDRHEDIKRWKAALFEVSNLTGFRHSQYTDESTLKKDIVARVLIALGPAQLQPARYPVGLEQQSKVVLDILNQMGNIVGALGITGTGGIGKTTLATNIYNKQNNFTCRSFLKDVKDANMAKLKAKMVRDLLHEDMKKIGDFECCFQQIKKDKIFVVIDDIVKRSQFDELIPDMKNLAGGSRVLITSRDQNLLNNIMRDAGEKWLHEVEILSPSNSLQLFMKTAYHNDIPSPRLHDLSHRIADACGGLPLALEVIGEVLFDKKGDEALWCEATKALHKNEDIMDCLKLSYNSLGEVEQEMFLDVAFFLVGAPKDVALDFWNSDDYFNPASIRLCKLIDRCLLKVNENGFLTMHDLLQDMGRDVVMKKSPRNEGEQSHLCNPSSVIKVLEQNRVTIMTTVTYFPHVFVHVVKFP